MSEVEPALIIALISYYLSMHTCCLSIKPLPSQTCSGYSLRNRVTVMLTNFLHTVSSYNYVESIFSTFKITLLAVMHTVVYNSEYLHQSP